MSRWRVPRFVSTLVAFALLLALTACGGGRNVAAPVVAPQSPFAGPRIAPQPNAPPNGGGVVKVALLLPLSGSNSDLGKSMLEAAQLALFTTGGDKLTLVPRDTGGTTDGAVNAARSALSEGAQLILGPLLAAEVEAVKPVARDARVNMIAFSTATQLAGGNAFLMGFLPRQEVMREVSVAHDKGMSRFAALVPQSPYGRVMTDALRESAAVVGGTVAKVEYIDSRAADPGSAVQRLMAAGPAASSAPAGAGMAPPPAPAANVAFDALLLPEGGAQLKQIAQQLQAAGLNTRQVRLLGSGLWDDTAINGEPALYGGWFAASPPDQRREFEAKFQSTYGHPAPRLASLAFDAAALAAVLAKSGGPDPFTQEAIQNPGGFTGVDGLFRFTRDGLVQRGLAVLEVGPGGNTVVVPAPQNFADFPS